MTVFNIQEATYVCVTSAIFQDHEKWVVEKLSASPWKAIRVIDAVTLAKWLELAPSTMLWFAKECGLPAEGLYDAEQYLEELGIRFGAPVSPALVVSGRDRSVEDACKLITQDNKRVHVAGESVEEAAAFIAACVLTRAEALTHIPPFVFADSRANLSLLATHNVEMSLVPLDLEAVARAKSLKQPGWRMIFPEVAAGGSTERQDGVLLDRAKRTAIEQHLVDKLSLPEHKARQIARDSRGSLIALLWLIGSGPIGVPRWASRKDATTHASLILLGSWIGNNRNDTIVVEQLSQKSYRDIETLLQSALVPEGPWIYWGMEWLCASRDFVWTQLAPRITETMLDDFREAICTVVGELDPSLGMPASRRFMANILGKVRKHSGSLRKGMADSLARLATARSDGQAWADRVVRGLLDPDKPEPEGRWLGLTDVYSELAGAAPDMFLTCLDGFLNRHAASFFQDAKDTNTPFAPTSAHVYLLWAMERLAWHHEWFPRVLSALARLAQADPGGNTSNRPVNSLRTILLPWNPQHGEDLSKAAEALDMLYRAAPNVAWSVGISLLPTSWSVTSPTPQPEYRSASGKREVTDREYWEFVRAVVEKLTVWADSNASRLVELIEAYPELRRGRDDLGDLFTNPLRAVDMTALSQDDRVAVESTLRKVVSHHREHKDADWALPASDIKLLDTLRQSFIPFDLVLRHKHLFSWHPHIPDAPMNPHDQGWDEWLADQQDAATNAVFGHEGLNGVLRLAGLVELPSVVGRAMATCPLEDEALKLLINKTLSELPNQPSQSHQLECGRAYMSSKYRKDGDSWLEKVLKLKGVNWTPEQLANVALSISPGPTLWARVQAWGREADALYWKNVESRFRCLQHWPTMLEKWKEVRRPWSSVELLADVVSGRHQNDDAPAPSADQIMSVLEGAVEAGPEIEPIRRNGQMIAYYVEKLFECLDSLAPDASRLGRLEWRWLRILEHTKRGPKVLREQVTSSPDLFVDLLKILFRADGEEAPKVTDGSQKAMAEQAFRLLREIHRIPGVDPQGNVNGAQLRTWVVRSRELASEVGRLSVCDIQIGELLSYLPESPDRSWPCREVRELLEDFRSSEVERGLSIGKLSQRGVIFRGKGGKQEWELANKFKVYGEKVRVQWPRSAAVLDMLVRHYEDEARSLDERAKWDEYE